MAIDIKVFKDPETEQWVACLRPEEGYELVSADGNFMSDALAQLALQLECSGEFDAKPPEWWAGYEDEEEPGDLVLDPQDKEPSAEGKGDDEQEATERLDGPVCGGPCATCPAGSCDQQEAAMVLEQEAAEHEGE